MKYHVNPFDDLSQPADDASRSVAIVQPSVLLKLLTCRSCVFVSIREDAAAKRAWPSTLAPRMVIDSKIVEPVGPGRGIFTCIIGRSTTVGGVRANDVYGMSSHRDTTTT